MRDRNKSELTSYDRDTVRIFAKNFVNSIESIGFASEQSAFCRSNAMMFVSLWLPGIGLMLTAKRLKKRHRRWAQLVPAVTY